MTNMANKDEMLAAFIRETMDVAEASSVSSAPQLEEATDCFWTEIERNIFWKPATVLEMKRNGDQVTCN